MRLIMPIKLSRKRAYGSESVYLSECKGQILRRDGTMAAFVDPEWAIPTTREEIEANPVVVDVGAGKDTFALKILGHHHGAMIHPTYFEYEVGRKKRKCKIVWSLLFKDRDHLVIFDGMLACIGMKR